MPTPLAQPKIYHILHVDRLSSILESGCLFSDKIMSQRNGVGTTIGMSNIKHRRLSLAVDCHRGTYVGDYVPFYFCTRSVMLYMLYRGNHVELGYQGGQEPIVHLEADLRGAVDWANGQGKRWAFTSSNAAASYTLFHCDLAKLDKVNWSAVTARDFRQPEIKEGKQAEFLMHESFPWELFGRIGVHSQSMVPRVMNELRSAAHRPSVEIHPDWYY